MAIICMLTLNVFFKDLSSGTGGTIARCPWGWSQWDLKALFSRCFSVLSMTGRIGSNAMFLCRHLVSELYR